MAGVTELAVVAIQAKQATRLLSQVEYRQVLDLSECQAETRSCLREARSHQQATRLERLPFLEEVAQLVKLMSALESVKEMGSTMEWCQEECTSNSFEASKFKLQVTKLQTSFQSHFFGIECQGGLTSPQSTFQLNQLALQSLKCLLGLNQAFKIRNSRCLQAFCAIPAQLMCHFLPQLITPIPPFSGQNDQVHSLTQSLLGFPLSKRPFGMNHEGTQIKLEAFGS